MQIYLPIAEMSVDVFGVLALGGIAGLLTGTLGVGGGFLITPLLMSIGVPPAIAVASSANQIVASSFSSFLANLRGSSVDFKMAGFMMIGGLSGSIGGVYVFKILKNIGQIDLIISVCYFILLLAIGGLMAYESFSLLLNKKPLKIKKNSNSNNRIHKRNFLHKMPLRVRFPVSGIYISCLLPIIVGFAVAVLVSLMGVGGGFFLVPAMIYIIGMPTASVIGTSLLQVIFISSNVTLLQAYMTHTVDIILSVILLSSAVIFAQIGYKWSARVPTEKLRAILSIVVLTVAFNIAYSLFVKPNEIYSIIENNL